MHIVALLIPLLYIAVCLVLLYWVVRSAVVAASRKARGEAWIEANLPDKALWLPEAQRAVLAAEKAKRRPADPHP